MIVQSSHRVNKGYFLKINKKNVKKSFPPVSQDIQDDVVAAYHFEENLARRYEPRHPEFFLGPLEDAIKEVRSQQKLFFKFIFNNEDCIS